MDLETNMIPAGVTMQAQALPRNTYNLSSQQHVNQLSALPSAPPQSVIYQVLPPVSKNRVHPVAVPQAQSYQVPSQTLVRSSASSSACRPLVIALSVVAVLLAITGIVIAVVWISNNNNNNNDAVTIDLPFCDYTCHNSPFSPCISSSNICDGNWDCPEGEDETGCSTTNCDGFSCSSETLCIASSWRCDGIIDCNGGEDEEGCNSTPAPVYCEDGTLYCDGICISDSYLCNGINECSDGADEAGCSDTCFGYTCPYGAYFQYGNYGPSGCIHQSSVCDGIEHCIGGFDEQECVTISPLPITFCSWNSVLCDGKCIPSYQVCDGFAQCSDGSDETDCTKDCSSDEFLCESGTETWYYGYCIPLIWQCDNIDDCLNAADEQNCPADVCSATQFTCVNGGDYGNCVPSGWECDGLVDCEGGTDEANCECGAGEFRCEAGTTAGGSCISTDKKCDGNNDCSDGADEHGCVQAFACKDPTTLLSIDLPKAKFCDNTENCVGGIDEDKCLIAPDGPGGGNVQIHCVNTGGYYKFCSAHWEQSTGDAACAALGYSTMSESKAVAGATVVQGILVSTDARFNLEELTHRNPVNCPDNSVIEFKCAHDASCGLVSKNVPRVVGGVDATIADHPWQASIQQGSIGSDWTHFCGAIIIADDWAMTSAHCVDFIPATHFSSFRVVAGNTKLSDTVTDTNAYAIKNIIYHPLYEKHTKVLDIALIQVSTAFVRSSTIQPACLPAPGEIFTEGVDAAVTGWGTTQEGGSTVDVLQVAFVPLLNTEACRNIFSSLTHYITGDMICAGIAAGGKDTCQGDSGGPLVTTRNSRKYAAGVTSWGVGCARPNRPGVYTEVSDILDWARREMMKVATIGA